jgi:hypothetical protein
MPDQERDGKRCGYLSRLEKEKKRKSSITWRQAHLMQLNMS